jgi:hypothetical protein
MARVGIRDPGSGIRRTRDRGDCFDSHTRQELHTASSAFVEERVEHVARAVGVREELAMCLLVKRDPERGEPSNDITRRKRFEDLSDDCSVATIEVALADRDICDVAARPATDENLRARTGG